MVLKTIPESRKFSRTWPQTALHGEPLTAAEVSTGSRFSRGATQRNRRLGEKQILKPREYTVRQSSTNQIWSSSSLGFFPATSGCLRFKRSGGARIRWSPATSRLNSMGAMGSLRPAAASKWTSRPTGSDFRRWVFRKSYTVVLEMNLNIQFFRGLKDVWTHISMIMPFASRFNPKHRQGRCTLDEPVMETIMRDLRSIGTKLKYVMLPRARADKGAGLREFLGEAETICLSVPCWAESSLRWDLWGPLVLCLALGREVDPQKNPWNVSIVSILFWLHTLGTEEVVISLFLDHFCQEFDQYIHKNNRHGSQICLGSGQIRGDPQMTSTHFAPFLRHVALNGLKHVYDQCAKPQGVGIWIFSPFCTHVFWQIPKLLGCGMIFLGNKKPWEQTSRTASLEALCSPYTPSRWDVVKHRKLRPGLMSDTKIFQQTWGILQEEFCANSQHNSFFGNSNSSLARKWLRRV